MHICSNLEKFLGFMVSKKKVLRQTRKKIHAIAEMRPRKSVKEVQVLTRRVATLNRFVSKFAERCRPFFKMLRGRTHFTWTSEYQQAFEKLKAYLSSPPLLTQPMPQKDLYLYLATANETVAAVLVCEVNDTTCHYTTSVKSCKLESSTTPRLKNSHLPW